MIPKNLFASRMADAVCAVTPDCCGKSGARFDDAYCHARVVKSWTKEMDLAGGFDAEKAAECVAQVSKVAATCNASTTDIRTVPACEAAIARSDGKPLGGPCASKYDCALPLDGEVLCIKETYAEGEVGKCGVQVDAKLGAACAKTLRPSDCFTHDSLTCGKSGVCEPLAKAGEACRRSSDCFGSAVCRSGQCLLRTGQPCTETRSCGRKEMCIAGKCAPAMTIGQACAGVLDCAEGSCAANTKTCATWSGVWLCQAP